MEAGDRQTRRTRNPQEGIAVAMERIRGGGIDRQGSAGKPGTRGRTRLAGGGLRRVLHFLRTPPLLTLQIPTLRASFYLRCNECFMGELFGKSEVQPDQEEFLLKR